MITNSFQVRNMEDEPEHDKHKTIANDEPDGASKVNNLNYSAITLMKVNQKGELNGENSVLRGTHCALLFVFSFYYR